MARIAPMPPQQQYQGATKSEKIIMNGSATVGSDTMSFDDKSLHVPGDHSADQLSKLLVTAAVVKSGRNSPGTNTTISDESEINYTDDVKRKYYHNENTNRQNHDSHTLRNDPGHIIDEGIPPKVVANHAFVPLSNQSSLLSDGSGIGDQFSSIDNNVMDKIRGGIHQTKSDSSRTPPLTLYSNDAIPRQKPSSQANLINGNNSNMIEGAGYLSPCSGIDMSSVEANTQTLHAMTMAPDLNSISEYNPQASSVCSTASSRGSMSTTPHSYIKQPVLYSAIGSLEHVNCNSLTNLNKRYLAPSKEFCKPGDRGKTSGQSLLIPPARPFQSEQIIHSTTHSSTSIQKEILVSKQTDRVDISSDPNNISNPSEKEELSWRSTSIDINSSKATIKTNNTSEYYAERQTIAGLFSGNEEDTKTNAKIGNTNANSNSQHLSQTTYKAKKKVSYDPIAKGKKSKKKTVEMFRPSSDAYTPRIERKTIKYKAAEARPSVQQMSSPMGTLQRPNFRDALRRVAMIIHQHIIKIESRFEQQGEQLKTSDPRIRRATKDGLFHASMRDMFNEDSYRTPTYKCNMVRIPMARPGMVYGLRKIKVMHKIPSETEIYDFGHQLFKSVQLSSECSIVCLIYVERLMEVAKVPLLACTWRPIFMCGLLLASKVWQDLSSWNIEFSNVYPQFSLEAINKLELNFLRNVKWDLYISSR